VIVPHRLHAPRQDGAVLAEPSLADVPSLLADNRRRLTAASPSCPGLSFEELRGRARQAALAAAQDYHRRAGEPIPAGDSTSLLLAGHQPELFHPGVWIKNFALYRLAREHGATPVNLVVDNDTAKTTLLRLPTTEGQPAGLFRKALVPFDRFEGEAPYEERVVHDEELFAGLPGRIASLVRDWNYAPLLPAFWEEVARQTQRTPLLGERFAAARRVFERRWGCLNLELPVSVLCQTEPFAWFACHLLTNLPRFHALYNEAVHQYRRQYGLRSRNHPVPDLATEGDWLEVPFWAWRRGQPGRGRLFARLTPSAIELRAGKDSWPAIPADQELRPPMLAAWQDLERQGLKVRSRALTNTLYARVFLADLFVHGIGGGKYDELTDEIIRRFYGFEPPRFLVLSATLLLPLPRLPVRPESARRLAHDLRDLHCNPQRHLADSVAEAADLGRQKEAWIVREPADRHERRERFRVLRDLTRRLEPYMVDREKALRQEIARCQQQLAAKEVLERRDYGFCLYPEAELRAFCTRFL
jgi:hypothetical protein